MKKPKKNEKKKVNENRNHMPKMTSANARDHSIFVESWMCPFSLKYLFCVMLIINAAVITADKRGCTQT